MTDFAIRLKNCMELRGKTQTDIAKNCHIDKGNLSHYLKGDFIPKQNIIIKIAHYLNVSPSYLLGLSDQMVVPIIQPTNTIDGSKSQKSIIIDEIMANCTWLDLETLKNISAMIETLAKGKKPL